MEDEKDLLSLVKKKEEENQAIKELLLRKEKELTEQQNNALKVEMELQQAKIREFLEKKEKESQELKNELLKKEESLKNILEEKSKELKTTIIKREEEANNLRQQLRDVTGGLSKSVDAIISQLNQKQGTYLPSKEIQQGYQPTPVIVPAEITYQKVIEERIDKINELEKLVKSLKKETKEKEEKISEITNKLEETIASEELRNVQTEFRIKRILEEKESLRIVFEKEAENLKTRIKEAETILKIKENEIQDIKTNFDKEVLQLNSNILLHLEEITFLRDEVLQKEREKQDIIESRTRIQQHFISTESKYVEEKKLFETKISEKDEEISSMRNSLTSTINELNNKISNNEEEVNLFKTQITNLQEQLNRELSEREKIQRQKEEEKLALKKELIEEKNSKLELQKENQINKITLANIEQELKTLKRRFRIFFLLEKVVKWKKQ